jgi:predicted Zn-dependent protease
MIKKTMFFAALLYLFLCGGFAQSTADSQKEEKPGVVTAAAKEAWGLYKQYKRVTGNLGAYWEDEIASGVRSGKYIQSAGNSQYQRIKRIFDRLLKTPHLSKKEKDKYNWRIYVQNSGEANAFAALDGIIVVNRGMIDYCKNDDELAIIIGHEIAHMTENHLKKAVASDIVKDYIAQKTAAVIARKKNQAPPDTELSDEEIAKISDKEMSDRELFNLIFGLAGDVALLKYSRSQEEEADEEGAKFAASMGYNTDAGYALWSRMSADFGSNRWLNFLSTHPTSEKRAKNFADGNYMRKYYKKYEG